MHQFEIFLFNLLKSNWDTFKWREREKIKVRKIPSNAGGECAREEDIFSIHRNLKRRKCTSQQITGKREWMGERKELREKKIIKVKDL